jgi:uncharacterized membrane protein YphA (DoxX/SURF4 family)
MERTNSWDASESLVSAARWDSSREKMGMPWPIAFLVIVGESFGSLALLAGFLTRFTAASLAVIMTGAIVMVHLSQGFFMNWSGQLITKRLDR